MCSNIAAHYKQITNNKEDIMKKVSAIVNNSHEAYVLATHAVDQGVERITFIQQPSDVIKQYVKEAIEDINAGSQKKRRFIQVRFADESTTFNGPMLYVPKQAIADTPALTCQYPVPFIQVANNKVTSFI